MPQKAVPRLRGAKSSQRIRTLLKSGYDVLIVDLDDGEQAVFKKKTKGVVLVTGASGFIATHVVKQALEAGYRVRGTVRSKKNEEKIKYLIELVPDSKYKLELFEADLSDPESWNLAVKDAAYVLHVASPLDISNSKDPDALLGPAVDGTLNVLKACVKSKTVKRVVLTSSLASVVLPGLQGNAESDKNHTYSEGDWLDSDKCKDAYARSKVLAERAAWKYVEELSDEDKIELAVINPGLVIGPILHNSRCAVMEIMERMLVPSVPAVLNLNFGTVDVRDVATAHVIAMTVPEAAGHRHLLINKTYWFKEFATILRPEFAPQGYKVPSRVLPYFVLWCMSFVDTTVAWLLPQIGVEIKIDNTRMKEVLGIEPIAIERTLIDMAYSMIEKGFIKKTKKYRGPPTS